MSSSRVSSYWATEYRIKRINNLLVVAVLCMYTVEANYGEPYYFWSAIHRFKKLFCRGPTASKHTDRRPFMNLSVDLHPYMGQNDVLSIASARAIDNEPCSPIPSSPRRRKMANNDNNGLTKEMISRAFPKSPSKQRVRGDNELDSSIKSIKSIVVPVRCGTPRRSTSPRRTIRRATPGCRKQTIQKSELLHLIKQQELYGSLSNPENHDTVMGKQHEPKNVINDQISSATMKTIADHKTVIADLRPQRKRVKFIEQPIGDDDKKLPSRIHSLTLQDLCILGSRHDNTASSDLTCSFSGLNYYNAMQQGEAEMSDSEDTIRQLESKICHSIGMLSRLDELIEQEKVLAKKIEAENQELRRQLVSRLPAAMSLSKLQSQKKMTNTIESLEKQLKEL